MANSVAFPTVNDDKMDIQSMDSNYKFNFSRQTNDDDEVIGYNFKLTHKDWGTRFLEGFVGLVSEGWTKGNFINPEGNPNAEQQMFKDIKKNGYISLFTQLKKKDDPESGRVLRGAIKSFGQSIEIISKEEATQPIQEDLLPVKKGKK